MAFRRTGSEGGVGKLLVEPMLAFGAAAGSAELSAEPFLEAFGSGVADQVRDGVAEAAVFRVTEFCDDAGPEGPFVEGHR